MQTSCACPCPHGLPVSPDRAVAMLFRRFLCARPQCCGPGSSPRCTALWQRTSALAAPPSCNIKTAQQFGTSRHPWYDCAIVRFDASDDPEEEKWQLGYVQIGIIFEAAGENYMLVRWMTSAQLGGAIENSQNEFESHHIRNLPRLKWNPRTRNCNRSFQIMPVSLSSVERCVGA